MTRSGKGDDADRAIPLVRVLLMTDLLGAKTGPDHGYWAYLSLGPLFEQYQVLADAYAARNRGEKYAADLIDPTRRHAKMLEDWLNAEARRNGKTVQVTIPVDDDD